MLHSKFGNPDNYGKKQGRGRSQINPARHQGSHARNMGPQGRYQVSDTTRNQVSFQGHQGMRNFSWRNQTPCNQKWGSQYVEPWIQNPNHRPSLLPTPGIPFNQETSLLRLMPLNGNSRGGLPNIPLITGPNLSYDAALLQALSQQSQQSLQALATMATLNSENPVNLHNNLSNYGDIAGVRKEAPNLLFNQQANNQSIIQQPIQRETVPNESRTEGFFVNGSKPYAGMNYKYSTTNIDNSLPQTDQPEDVQASGDCNPKSGLGGSPAEFQTNKTYQRIQRRIRGRDKLLAGVLTDSVYCHICQKQFEGSKSLVDHLGGRPHREKKREKESNYIMKQKQLRQTAMLEAARKHAKMPAEAMLRQQHCDVCDVHYVGDVSQHKRLQTHKSLEVYYKPKCEPCCQSFPTRVKYEEHISTVEHIRNVGLPEYEEYKRRAAARKEARLATEKAEKAEKDLKEEEEEADGDDKEEATAVTEKKREDEHLAVNEHPMEVKKEIAVSPAKQADSTTPLSLSTADCRPPTSQPLEPGNNKPTGGTKRKLPKELDPYDPDVRVGEDYLIPKTGWMCSLCTSFLPSDNAVHVHLTSRAHYEKCALRLKKSRSRGSIQQKNSKEPSKPSFELEDLMKHEDGTIEKNETKESNETIKESNETMKESNDSLSKSTLEHNLEIEAELSSTRPITRIAADINYVDGDEDDAPEDDGNWKRQKVSAGGKSEPLPSATLFDEASSIKTSKYENPPYAKATGRAASSNEVSEDTDYILGSVDEDIFSM